VNHQTKIEYVPYNGGYPFRATCVCGWKSKTYAANHAAQTMADEHISDPARVNFSLLL
jgi:hypothetical protein